MRPHHARTLSLTLLSALVCLALFRWGYARGRQAARVELASSITQAARNGYDEGYEDAAQGREETGPRMATLLRQTMRPSAYR